MHRPDSVQLRSGCRHRQRHVRLRLFLDARCACNYDPAPWTTAPTTTATQDNRPVAVVLPATSMTIRRWLLHVRPELHHDHRARRLQNSPGSSPTKPAPPCGPADAEWQLQRDATLRSTTASATASAAPLAMAPIPSGRHHPAADNLDIPGCTDAAACNYNRPPRSMNDADNLDGNCLCRQRRSATRTSPTVSSSSVTTSWARTRWPA